MKRHMIFLALTMATSSIAFEPTWLGHKIINKTDQQLNIQVLCSDHCGDKKNSTCKSFGYILLVPPQTTVINKKDSMVFESNNSRDENALIVKIENNDGRSSIPAQIIKNPEAKDYTISLSRNMLVIK